MTSRTNTPLWAVKHVPISSAILKIKRNGGWPSFQTSKQTINKFSLRVSVKRKKKGIGKLKNGSMVHDLLL